jgi:hypothetical protein
MMEMVTDHDPLAIEERRRLVQRILTGGIPSGKEFEACREQLKTAGDESTTFKALFTLLEGALADPFFLIEETERVVPVLRGLARGEIEAKDLL